MCVVILYVEWKGLQHEGYYVIMICIMMIFLCIYVHLYDVFYMPPTHPQKVTSFTKDITNLTIGEELRNGAKLNLFSDLRKEFGTWKAHLDASGETCECAMLFLFFISMIMIIIMVITFFFSFKWEGYIFILKAKQQE